MQKENNLKGKKPPLKHNYALQNKYCYYIKFKFMRILLMVTKDYLW